ncbi:hypothetical protein U1Q18_002184 [Sarracenia purpurea var. burkii]
MVRDRGCEVREVAEMSSRVSAMETKPELERISAALRTELEDSGKDREKSEKTMREKRIRIGFAIDGGLRVRELRTSLFTVLFQVAESGHMLVFCFNLAGRDRHVDRLYSLIENRS